MLKIKKMKTSFFSTNWSIFKSYPQIIYWEMIDTIHGATSFAIIYSIAETVKANNLKPYDYFEYLLTEIPKHVEDKNTGFLEELLPWSETLPEHIRKPKKTSDE